LGAVGGFFLIPLITPSRVQARYQKVAPKMIRISSPSSPYPANISYFAFSQPGLGKT
jgi:hypothetical protein